MSTYERGDLTPGQLARLYTVMPINRDERVIRRFEEFIDTTGFSYQNLYNYDFFDMFEWEITMCQWHGYLLLENDMSFDTFILFNNREILRRMLSLPYEDRLGKKLFIGVIKRLWPDLLKFPVNGAMLRAD
jgi:hypothetical protein